MKFWTRRPAVAAPAALAPSRAGIMSSVRPIPGRRRPRDGRIRRTAATMSVLLAAVALAAAAGIPAGASVPVSASAPGWSVTPTPNPVMPTCQLFWVSCPAANSCMAVGTYTKASGAGVTLAEQWNGSKWRILPIPSPRGAAWSNLFGVSCVSPSACEAVGATASRSGTLTALAERWNGSSWQIQHAPSPAGGQLNGGSCTSPSACTAVGGSGAGPLAERWNGTRWSIQATPNAPQGNGFLSGVACTSATACTAVGASNPFTPSATTLAERWNGTRWTLQATPNPPQGGGGLNGVSCTSASACIAAGNSNAGTLAERWNGTRWRIQPTPTPAGAQFAFLNTVACPAAADCTAAGAYINSSGAFQTLVERWNGTRWRIQATPNQGAGAASLLIGVACTSAAACTAVGYSDLNGSTAVLVERSAGRTWRIQAAPSPPGAASSFLNSVWCASASACITVGATTNKARTPATLAERWNGRAWAIRPTPSPAGGGALNGVSCTSLSACTAVGGRGDGKTLAERWNGVRWRIQFTPNPATSAPFIALNAVACTSSSACMAVGGKVDSSGNAVGTLAERWNGKNWHIVPTFKPNGLDSFLGGVACTSSSACTAVGSSSLVTTLAERWNGTRWQVQATPNPPGGGNIFFTSVACPTATACTAFGLNLTSTGPLTLAERWNGQGWAIQPTPAIPTFDIGPPGVACPTVSSCFAVASYVNNGDPRLTLAEQWTGTPGSSSANGNPAAPGGAALACAISPVLKFTGALRASLVLPQRGSIPRALTNRTSAVWPAHACRLAPS